MRVLQLIHAFNRGGLESWLLNMLEQIPRDVCAIDVCCKGDNTGPWAQRALDSGAEVIHCPLRPSHIGFARGFSELLKTGRYDLLHNHLDVYSGLPVLIARRTQTPVMCTFHNTDFSKAHPWWLRLPVMEQLRGLYGRFSMRYAIQRADLVTAVSQGVLDVVTEGKTIHGADPKVLYLGVIKTQTDTGAGRADVRSSLGLREETPLAIHVGRFMDLKNHRGLISIFEIVLRTLPEARLLLVGDGVLKPDIERLVRDRGLEAQIRFLGPRDDVPALMNASDLFLLPSLFEGLPIVALEANSAGLPVVGSNVPGLVEAANLGLAARLHEVDDIRGMAEDAIHLLSHRTAAKELGLSGRARIEDFFGVEASSLRLIDMYTDLLMKVGRAGAHARSAN